MTEVRRASPDVVLSSGARMPRIGLGVYRSPRGEATREAVREALRLGYRHVDTASAYGNEADVATAMRQSGATRGDVFLTTKLWNDDQGYDKTLRAFDAALARMDVDYVDLFLLHWPVPGLRLHSWRALERLNGEGRARAIGVSNFMVPHLEELLAHASTPPHVNQIEVSPFHQQREVRALCARHGIVVQAYSPLTKGARLAHPVVLALAGAATCTPAQVLLAWGLARELVVLPKSTRPERLAENLASAALSLSGEALAQLDALDEGLATGWDPRGEP